MKIGIVGAEKAKFTDKGRTRARRLIRGLLSQEGIEEVISGGCHLGGIDRWAVDLARERKLAVKEFIPATRSWELGYKPRNLLIAERSDVVHCIVVDKLPEGFSGMRFAICYHCGRKDHVKSGGCWTMKQARKMGKKGILHIVRN